MDLAFVQKILPRNLLTRVKKILLAGGQGDALYCRDFIEIVRYLKTENPTLQIVLTTNGSHKNEKWWTEVAKILNRHDTVIFSVDGWDDESNQKYRVNSDFESILKGVDTLKRVNDQVYIVWSTIIFRFNQHRLDDIKELARETGADAFNIVLSSLFGSWYPHYIDSQLGHDPLEPDAQLVSSYQNSDRGLFVKFSKHKSLESISPLVSQFVDRYIETYKESYVMPMCRIGERGLYVDAEGILYPCSWVSHPFGIRQSQRREKTIRWEKSLWVEHKDKFNLHQHSLTEVLGSSLWKGLACSWLDPQKSFVECENKCHWSQSAARVARVYSPGVLQDSPENNEALQMIRRYKKSVAGKAEKILNQS